MGDIDWQHLLFSFDGRINRGKFWLGAIGLYAVPWILWLIAFAIGSSVLYTLVGILTLLVIWPALAISVKRWHDRDKSGWWILIGFVPLIGGLWALIETGFLEGTKGDNQYGPDPLAG